ncbi:lymphocyte-specific protein 1 [Rhinophrynus dorsalis]
MSDSEEVQREEGCEEQTFQVKLEETERLTTQWSVEDEEEAARERRRRERERQQQDQTGEEGQTGGSLNDEHRTQSDGNVVLKPLGPMESEEDEGFSDWSQRLEQRKLRGACQEPPEEREETRATEEEESESPRANEEESEEALIPQSRVEEEEDEGTSRYEATEIIDEPVPCPYEHGSPKPCLQEVMPVSYSQWESRESPVGEEENAEGRASSPGVEEETHENEELRIERGYSTCTQESENLRDRWETEDQESRRRSVSSDGESEGNIMTTVKLTERAECLNRSIQKSNSIKKSEPPLPISKIDDRLEQYTQAIESSTKGSRLVRQPSLELLSPTDAVSTKKNRWETGDVATASKPSPCKDTEGINVGVSDLINQWGKGKSDPESPQSPPRPTEVRPGDVLSKKSLWEQSSKSGQSGKSSSANKKYKFVPTGHGKYEKVLVEDL